jgi:hypothetical protein
VTNFIVAQSWETYRIMTDSEYTLGWLLVVHTVPLYNPPNPEHGLMEGDSVRSLLPA